MEKGGWIYDWQPGTAWMDLWRWPVNLSSNCEIEIFVIKNEDLAIAIARDIDSGNHLDSPASDPKSGKKIKFLDSN